MSSEHPNRYVFAEEGATGLRPEPELLTMIRSRTHKLVHFSGNRSGQLFDLVADPGELDAIFEVPLTWLLQDQRSHTDAIRHGERVYYVPSYAYQDYVIWGLSAMMLVELLAVGFARPISLDHAPPGRPVRHLAPRPTSLP